VQLPAAGVSPAAQAPADGVLYHEPRSVDELALAVVRVQLRSL
jgi:hypothetical protein